MEFHPAQSLGTRLPSCDEQAATLEPWSHRVVASGTVDRAAQETPCDWARTSSRGAGALRTPGTLIGPGPPLEGLGALHMPGTLGPTPNPAPDSGDGHRPASPLTWPPDPTASGFMEASGKRMPAFASLHNFGRSSLGLAWGEVGVLGGAPSAPLHPLPPVLACSWPHPAGVPTVGGPHGSHLGSV